MMNAPRLKSLLHICALGALLFSPLGINQAQTLSLSSDSPVRYVVKASDTLWDIASLFLDEPWHWPQIWQQNPAIEDPDLIYPGDVLNLVYIDGNPRILLERGDRQLVRLSPQVKESPLASSIPLIPRQALNGFLAENRIVSQAEYEGAPYILSSTTDNLIMGAGHEIYVRGNWLAGINQYEVFRLGAAYMGSEPKELLGQEAIKLGSISILADEGNGIQRAIIVSSNQELKAGDRLLPLKNSDVESSIFPTTPVITFGGRIIGLLNDQGRAAQFESVVVNMGERDGLRVGDVMAIERSVTPIRDPISRETVALPPSEIGLLLTYRTFEKLSYGLILSLTQPATVGDIIRTP